MDPSSVAALGRNRSAAGVLRRVDTNGHECCRARIETCPVEGRTEARLVCAVHGEFAQATFGWFSPQDIREWAEVRLREHMAPAAIDFQI